MSTTLNDKLTGLLTKYTELLLGEGDTDNIEKVKAWILYSHISKSMPALAKHWNESYPEGKEEIIKVISEIKVLNEEHRKRKE